ncbi:MAG: scyllo-inosose 3-dehydrogenase [Christensenellaceae bacterium]|jgi:threonine dehydrogenase-like Zn-dependent dehydrogenase
MKCYLVEADFSPKEGYVLNEREKRDHRAQRSSMVFNNLRAGLSECEKPKPGPKDVLIKVGACGVCGTDMHAGFAGEDGYTEYTGHLRLPVIMGHEFSGEIVEVGSEVTEYKVGDLIAVEQIRWCGECFACRKNKFNSCINIEEVGLSMNGGFAEYAVVPQKYCVSLNEVAERLGDKMAALEAGALAEPTCVSYAGMMINGGGVQPGAHVAVFGSGPIGLAAVALARAAGAAKIFVFDTVDEKLELAKKVGADYVFNSITLAKEGSSPAERVLDITKGIGCGMVVECAGVPSKTYPDIVQLMSIGATVVQLGMGGALATIDLTPFQIKGCRIVGSLGHAGSDIYPSVIRMMAQGSIDMRKIVTGRFNLSDVEEGIEAAKSGKHGKVLISQHYK